MADVKSEKPNRFFWKNQTKNVKPPKSPKIDSSKIINPKSPKNEPSKSLSQKIFGNLKKKKTDTNVNSNIKKEEKNSQKTISLDTYDGLDLPPLEDEEHYATIFEKPKSPPIATSSPFVSNGPGRKSQFAFSQNFSKSGLKSPSTTRTENKKSKNTNFLARLKASSSSSALASSGKNPDPDEKSFQRDQIRSQSMTHLSRRFIAPKGTQSEKDKNIFGRTKQRSSSTSRLIKDKETTRQRKRRSVDGILEDNIDSIKLKPPPEYDLVANISEEDRIKAESRGYDVLTPSELYARRTTTKNLGKTQHKKAETSVPKNEPKTGAEDTDNTHPHETEIHVKDDLKETNSKIITTFYQDIVETKNNDDLQSEESGNNDNNNLDKGQESSGSSDVFTTDSLDSRFIRDSQVKDQMKILNLEETCQLKEEINEKIKSEKFGEVLGGESDRKENTNYLEKEIENKKFHSITKSRSSENLSFNKITNSESTSNSSKENIEELNSCTVVNKAPRQEDVKNLTPRHIKIHQKITRSQSEPRRSSNSQKTKTIVTRTQSETVEPILRHHMEKHSQVVTSESDLPFNILQSSLKPESESSSNAESNRCEKMVEKPKKNIVLESKDNNERVLFQGNLDLIEKEDYIRSKLPVRRKSSPNTHGKSHRDIEIKERPRSIHSESGDKDDFDTQKTEKETFDSKLMKLKQYSSDSRLHRKKKDVGKETCDQQNVPTRQNSQEDDEVFEIRRERTTDQTNLIKNNSSSRSTGDLYGYLKIPNNLQRHPSLTLSNTEDLGYTRTTPEIYQKIYPTPNEVHKSHVGQIYSKKHNPPYLMNYRNNTIDSYSSEVFIDPSRKMLISTVSGNPQQTWLQEDTNANPIYGQTQRLSTYPMRHKDQLYRNRHPRRVSPDKNLAKNALTYWVSKKITESPPDDGQSYLIGHRYSVRVKPVFCSPPIIEEEVEDEIFRNYDVTKYNRKNSPSSEIYYRPSKNDYVDSTDYYAKVSCKFL